MLYIKPEIFSLLDSEDICDLHVRHYKSPFNLNISTMPPYLYALYSLGGTNPAARTTLRAIVEEEMLHMLLACNILNAVGGKPTIVSAHQYHPSLAAITATLFRWVARSRDTVSIRLIARRAGAQAC